MRIRLILPCVIAILTLAVVTGSLGTPPSPARAEIPPHLGYGINVRLEGSIDPLFAPLGFEWIKLWEEYEDTPPAERLPYKVLFAIYCDGMPADLDAWGDHVEAIATAGLGLVEAYEIGNEPNARHFWGNDPPDPAQYVQVLQVAYERIKAVDPGATVVSAGLAPVGRIQGTCNGWNGNNCGAMDEREYARQMLLLGAGESFDVFGYHPYGFAYTPETDPYTVSNGFAFRGVEVMYEILEQHGLGYKSIWATEFNWIRDPSEDGALPWTCHGHSEYEDVFGWMDVSEAQQADYLVRAFQYADANWPWMGAMFVWNLDWYDYNWLCEASRYFSILKVDYTDYNPYGGSLPVPYTITLAYDVAVAPYTTTLAYDALATMEKRIAPLVPRLMIEPAVVTFWADVREPGVLTDVVVPLNVGYGVLTWTATVASGMQVTGTGTLGVQVTPTLAITTGLQGTPLTVTVDSTGYTTGTFTGLITVTATTTDVLDVPQTVPVILRVFPELPHVYLPFILSGAP